MSSVITEKLAQYAHGAWCRSMLNVFDNSLTLNDGTVKIPAKMVEQWRRQMNTLYKGLSEEEQKSDLKEADFIFDLIQGDKFEI